MVLDSKQQSPPISSGVEEQLSTRLLTQSCIRLHTQTVIQRLIEKGDELLCPVCESVLNAELLRTGSSFLLVQKILIIASVVYIT